MLDAPASITRIFAVQLLVDADDLGIGRVPDRVRRDLEAVRSCRVGERKKLRIRMELETAGLGFVGIGIFQPGAARAERPVRVEFDADHAQPVSVEPRGRTRLGLQQIELVGIDHQAEVEPPGVRGALHRFPAT
jgi:hypothetical protein